MKLLKRLLVAAACLSALVIGGYVAADWYDARQIEKAAKEAQDATPKVTAPSITVSRVETRDFVEYAGVSGSLVPREEILVSPEVEGFRVVALHADEGSVVKKGDVLAELVSEQLDAQVAQNEAALARSDAAIAQARSAIVEAEAAASEAAAQLERAKPLKKSGYLSGSVYDQRESAARTTAAKLTAAKDALAAAEAEKKQVLAQKREITWRQSKTEVTAPADGLVSRRSARIGAMATSIADPMFRIIENGEIELDAEVVETRLPKIKLGQKATVTLPGAQSFGGKVRLISPEVDRNTRLGRVRIFIGADPALHIGAFARAKIETDRSNGLSVPNSAVTFTAEGAFVQVVKGTTIHQRKIETGLIVGKNVEVVAGLKLGDLVVSRAGTFLRDGDEIRPVMPRRGEQMSEAR